MKSIIFFMNIYLFSMIFFYWRVSYSKPRNFNFTFYFDVIKEGVVTCAKTH